MEDIPNLELAGQIAATVYCTSVAIIDDDIAEDIECFSVLASYTSDGRNVTIEPDTATVCIEDNGKLITMHDKLTSDNVHQNT